MAKTIFEVEISNNSPKSYETATTMRMPATWAEFNDAIQKARIADARACKNELIRIHYPGITGGLIGTDNNLYDLNLLAQRLAALTEDQKLGMDALLKMEQKQHSGPASLECLINLTYNTDICRLVPQISNHQELGAFLYENEMLADEAIALLDTTEEGSGFRERLLELLGEEHQEEHGGVFTSWGYAERDREVQPIYTYRPGEVAYFHRSGAPVVLAVAKGAGETAVLDLPVADAGIRQALAAVGADTVEECTFRCVDCLIPSLRPVIDEALEGSSFDQVHEFARLLARKERVWGEAEFVKYKAILEGIGCSDLQNAQHLLDEAEQYELCPQVAQTWDYAEMVFREKYPDLPEALFQTPQAAEIGRAMLEGRAGAITEYGLLRRKDGQPLPEFRHEETQGMEMMM